MIQNRQNPWSMDHYDYIAQFKYSLVCNGIMYFHKLFIAENLISLLHKHYLVCLLIKAFTLTYQYVKQIQVTPCDLNTICNTVASLTPPLQCFTIW